MSKNQKLKNNALARLYNILDYNSKRNINLKNERYLGSLSHRLKEISGEEVYYRKKLDSKIEDNGVKSLKPKVIIHTREVKKEPKIFEPKIEEKKSVFIDEDVFEIKKVEVKEPEFVEVKPKLSKEEIIEINNLKDETEKLPEWDEIVTIKKEEDFEELPELESVPQETIKKEEVETFEEIETKEEEKKQEIKDEQLPIFIPIKKVEEKKLISEWEPIEIEKPKEEVEPIIEKEEEKTNVFRDIKSIDEKTANLLIDSGITTIALLDSASIKELSKIKGIKKKTAKKIKEEIKEKTIEPEKETIVLLEVIEKEEVIEEQKPVDKKLIEETEEWSIPKETTSETQVWESVEEEPEEKESIAFEELPSDQEIVKPTIDDEEKKETFRDIKSIDDKIAILLFNNGYTSVDSIHNASIKDLIEIKGIKKKTAKKIKKELEKTKEIPVVIPIEVKEEKKDEFVKFKEDLEISKKELSSVSKELNNKEKTIKKLQNELDEKIKDLETRKTEVYNKDEEIKLLQNQTEQSKQELVSGLEELNKRQEEMELIEKELENKKLELESRDIEIEKRDEEIIELQNKLKEKSKKLETEDKELVNKKEEIEDIKNDLKTKTDKLDEKERIIKELQSELNSKQKDLEKKEKEIKIRTFEALKSIDEKTAIILFDNGITSIDELKTIPQKNLSKIKGIKRKTAKQIIKELDKKADKKSTEIAETGPKKKPDDYFVEKKIVTTDLKMKEEKKSTKYADDENDITKKEAIDVDKKIADEFSLEVIDDDIFKNVESIDSKTSKLLRNNGISSVDELKEASIKDLTKIKGIRKRLARKIKKEVSSLQEEKVIEKEQSFEKEKGPTVEDGEAEWEYYDEDLISKSKKEELKGFRHGDYGLYEKEIKTKSGNKRKVKFFSKAEPDNAVPIELPKGYEIKKNKKTGLPYLRKKK